MKSKVYFTDFRTTPHGDSVLGKLGKLMKKAGLGEKVDFKNKFVAIKIHFGEAGNISFLRPNYAKVVADFVKAQGGLPFLTDCNTLYVGSRKNALEHLDTANLNGFSVLSTGCHIIIADGLKGNDEVELPVPNGVHCKTAKIGRALADADIIINLTHFKCHEVAGIGGAIKNIGMGGGSKAGKMDMHSDGKPVIYQDSCVGCRICQRFCAQGALVLQGKKMSVDHSKCAGCGRCISICPHNAICTNWSQSDRLLDEKMAEYAAAILNGKPSFHINVVRDLSPNCDCHEENDAAIIPNIGMLASFDPVAIDVASADLCNQAPRLPNTALDNCQNTGDLFHDTHDNTNWKYTIDHAVKIGLGSDQYELIK